MQAFLRSRCKALLIERDPALGKGAPLPCDVWHVPTEKRQGRGARLGWPLLCSDLPPLRVPPWHPQAGKPRQSCLTALCWSWRGWRACLKLKLEPLCAVNIASRAGLTCKSEGRVMAVVLFARAARHRMWFRQGWQLCSARARESP